MFNVLGFAILIPEPQPSQQKVADGSIEPPPNRSGKSGWIIDYSNRKIDLNGEFELYCL